MHITVATGNPDKIQEISDIIKDYPNLDIHLDTIAGLKIPEPDEPYDNFIENACHKAKYYAQFTKAPTLSEDAGLCIETLDEFPGVKTKDFMLECGGLPQSFKKLEQMLEGKTNLRAWFTCAAALYIPEQELLITHQASDYGRMSFPARGDKGFGFDPVFIPDGYEQTMGELGHVVKNKIGHRAQAIRGVVEQLLYT